MMALMKRWVVALGLGVMLWPVHAARANERGWEYLIDKLIADGVEYGRVVAAFRDRRVRPFDGLEFSVNPPHEPRGMYRRFTRPASVAAARRCRARYAAAFESAERAYGVPASVLASILYVETGCGQNTGSQVILYRLARLAMANEPENLQRNLERVADEHGRLDPATALRVRARAQYLENTFYPEVRALFVVAERTRVSPLDIHGSGSGAFGYPQFLPTSYLKYGIDADGDGRVSLYDTGDAAASCARYFVGHGWHAELSTAQRRAAVWQYNHSDAYVDTVLTLAARLGGAPAVTRVSAKQSAKHAPPKQRRHRSTRKTPVQEARR